MVEVTSSVGEVITQREVALFARALKVKLRSYYLMQRKMSLAALKESEAKAKTIAEARMVKTAAMKENTNVR